MPVLSRGNVGRLMLVIPWSSISSNIIINRFNNMNCSFFWQSTDFDTKMNKKVWVLLDRTNQPHLHNVKRLQETLIFSSYGGHRRSTDIAADWNDQCSCLSNMPTTPVKFSLVLPVKFFLFDCIQVYGPIDKTSLFHFSKTAYYFILPLGTQTGLRK